MVEDAVRRERLTASNKLKVVDELLTAFINENAAQATRLPSIILERKAAALK